MTNDNDSTRALLAQIDSLVIQRDAAEAVARERLADNALLRANQLVPALAKAEDDRDAAQQMVAEMRAALALAQRHGVCIPTGDDDEANEQQDAADTIARALALSAPIAGRWCLASERDEAVRERDDSQACFQKAWTVATEANTRAEKAEAFEKMALGCRDAAEHARIETQIQLEAAERRESELGLQVVAQAARLRLATDLIAQVRGGLFSPRDLDALAAWDAVPGDVGVAK